MKKNFLLLIIIILIVSGLNFNSYNFIGKASENEWLSLSPMPTKRGEHGIAEFDGKIFVIGGQNENGNLDKNEVYDIATGTWSQKASMPTARSSFSIAVFQSKIYCFGGITGNIDNPELTSLTEVYDPITDEWEVKTSMPTARADLSANIVNDAIYLIGGKKFTGINPYYQQVNNNEVYFPGNDSWISKSPMFIPVFGYGSAVIEGKIYILGGARQFEEGGTATAVQFNQMYDPKIDAWRNLAAMPTAKSHGASGITIGITAPILIYYIGGMNHQGYSNTNYAYNIENNNWTIAEPLPIPRANMALARFDDVFFVIGGFDGNIWLDINEQYTPLEYGTILPKLSIISPENKIYPSNNVSLIISVNRATSWIGYSLDDKPNATTNGDKILVGLNDGSNKIIVYINDTFGNTVCSNVTYFSVDTKPPTISVLSPENKTYRELDVHSTIIIDEPVSWLGYSLDGQETITIAGNITLAVLPEGSHCINFYATDVVGNTGNSETVFFNIAPFPILLILSLSLIIIIIIMGVYLVATRNKGKNKTKNTLKN